MLLTEWRRLQARSWFSTKRICWTKSLCVLYLKSISLMRWFTLLHSKPLVNPFRSRWLITRTIFPVHWIYANWWMNMAVSALSSVLPQLFTVPRRQYRSQKISHYLQRIHMVQPSWCLKESSQIFVYRIRNGVLYCFVTLIQSVPMRAVSLVRARTVFRTTWCLILHR